MFNYVISNLAVMTIFEKLSSFGVQKEFMLSKALVLLSQLIASANRFCGNVTDIKIEIAYFRFQINGIQVSLPIKIGSSNIEISRSGSYVTAVSSECNIRVQFDGSQLVSVKVPRDYFGGKLAGICGNCNGNYSDDLQTKDGKDVSSSGRRGNSDIGNSYKVFDDADGPDSRLVQDSIYFAQ
jgi:hypothetical protein